MKTGILLKKHHVFVIIPPGAVVTGTLPLVNVKLRQKLF
ncbi:hypothetical protein ADICYQ_1440 [Cyclobacterium qasimii M12-11B]|uniref:Uncharacterized protein n=1 Tax=Cyclobacterium qasimii M12-11B TaxID=641524 RepID=S7VHH6_9BACT|nr:hypothetical protein ADICYQ_1440 [Cyclobacterium qasimii M12-11B]